MLASLYACSDKVGQAKPGDGAGATGYGTADGYGGDVALKVEIDEGGSFTVSIESITGESAGIGDMAARSLVSDINAHQSVGVDTMSGATVTSAAVIEAARTALQNAGIEPDSVSTPVVRGGVDIEDTVKIYDVIVVGAGGAGLTAAIEAAQSGADVLVIEKLSQPGGSTARSSGVIMGSQTDDQRNNLISDTNVAFASYLYEFSKEAANSTSIMQLADNSALNILFLREMGTPISRIVEAAYNSDIARNHIITDGQTRSGGYMIEPLVKAAKNLGVTILCELEAFEVTTAVTGTATGVRARTADGETYSFSSYSVVLATGGFDRNAALTEQLTGVLPAEASYSGLGSMGDGLLMASDALAVYSAQGNGLIAKLWDFNADTNGSAGLLVTPEGRRFVNESKDAFDLESALMKAGFNKAWLILGSSGKTGAVSKAVTAGLAYSAATVTELASIIGAPQLESELSRYNAACEKGRDYYYDKDAAYLSALKHGPYYAVPYTTVSYGSIGGLQTNLSCEIIGEYGAIEGLYGAGELTNGSYFSEALPAFGASLAEVIETGRISGRNAASFALEQRAAYEAELAAAQAEADATQNKKRR